MGYDYNQPTNPSPLTLNFLLAKKEEAQELH